MGDDCERGVGTGRPFQRGHIDAVHIAASADQQRRREQRHHDRQESQGASGGELAARLREGREQGEQDDNRVKKGRRVRGRVGQRQHCSRGHHPAGRVMPLPSPDHEPHRQGHQEQRHSVVGGERAKMQRRPEDREQCSGEESGPAPEQSASGSPEHDGGSEHEDEGQDPRSGEAPEAVGQRTEGRIDDRGPREVRGELGERRAVQHVRPLQMTRPQIKRLVLEHGVGPHQPEREDALGGQHGQQRPAGQDAPARDGR